MSLFTKTNPMNKDLRFSVVYPKQFWDTKTGAVLKYTVITAVVGAVTYFTVGAGAMTAVSALLAQATPGMLSLFWAIGTLDVIGIGTWIASYMAVSSIVGGSFAVISGITALCAVGDLAIAGAIYAALGYVPSGGKHRDEMEIIKPSLFYDNLSPVIKDDLKEARKALKLFTKEHDKSQAERFMSLLRKVDSKLYDQVLRVKDDTTAYNYLMMAVIRYNLDNFSGAEDALRQARNYADPSKSSVLDYIEALLAFRKGNEDAGMNLLHKISLNEPKRAVSYILMAQIHTKNKYHMKAFHVLDNGIKNTSEETCVMNWMAGNSLYNTGEYEGAITYYKEALWNMRINEYEAIYKLCIAKCYKKLGKYDEGLKWLDDAVSEVKKNEKMVEELKAQYFAD
ncbi:MAG: hypothetical protein IJQ15_01165 [Synergistaceae bacterium]|nr:hypothetical protein [Synergistaceae bacterium]